MTYQFPYIKPVKTAAVILGASVLLLSACSSGSTSAPKAAKGSSNASSSSSSGTASPSGGLTPGFNNGASLAADATKAGHPSTYTFGIITGYSGPGAVYGQYFDQAEAMWKMATGGTVNGRKVKFIKVDNQNLPQDTPTAYQKMLSEGNPIAFELANTPSILSVLKQFTQAKLPDFNAGGVGDSLSGASPYLINIFPLTGFEAKPLAKYVYAHGIKTVAGIYPNDGFGRSTYPQFLKYFEALGGKSLGSFTNTLTQTDFRAVASKLAALNPDAVYVGAYGNPVTTFYKELRQAGYTGKLIGSSVEEASYTTSAGSATNGMMMTAFNPTPNGGQLEKWYYTTFQKKFGTPPGLYQALLFEVPYMWTLGLERLAKEGLPATGTNLVKACQQIGSFQSPVGPMTLPGDNNMTAPISIIQVKNGQFVTLAADIGAA